MAVWPGGPCPECGDEMPARLLRCMNCRTPLNTDLTFRQPIVPEFSPLEEIESVIETSPTGYYATCPNCRKELKIHGKYSGQSVACKFCQSQFRFVADPLPSTVVAFYLTCPHCSQELKAASKYRRAKVACKHCDGSIHIV